MGRNKGSNKMKRSQERLQEIDSYLMEHYTKDGGRSCADALGESKAYISSRVQYTNLTESTGSRKKPKGNNSIAVLSGKINAKNKEIEELNKLVIDLRKINSELRAANIILIIEKHKWKTYAEKNI